MTLGRFKRATVGALALGLLVWAACKKEDKAEQAEAGGQGGEPAGIAVAAVSTSATVEAIDRDHRTVTLKAPDGTTKTYKLSKDLVNLDQIQVGDRINARLLESVAVFVRKSEAPPSAGEAAVVALAPKGARPGVVMADTAEITARIETIDPTDRTLTLEGVAGKPRTFKVGPDVDLGALKKGDDVTVRFTEALALLDEQPRITGTPVGPSSEKLSPEEARDLATQAYIYGYPLITMDTTRRVMTNAAKPEANHAPMGQFVNLREYPKASFRDVTAPNADTLYSAAWLDLSKEPYVLHIPDMGDRYYLMPVLDGWTNVFASPGKRTGVKQGDFAITGPGWTGKLPEGVKEFKSPTNMVWIIGRIYSSGTPEDYKTVWALQDKLALTPLSAWGKEYQAPEGKVDPSIDMKTPPREQVNRMDAKAFFSKLAMLMKDNPPAQADAPMVEKLARLGIVPGREFDVGKLDPAVAKAMEDGCRAGLEKIQAEIPRVGKRVNGWQITMTGEYGTDYLFRSAIAFAGLGANLAEDACYPTATVDSEGKPLDASANRYVWRFASKDDLPPVNGFWSLTMYNDQFFFVENPLNRYTLSQRDDLKANPDGSIVMYIQKDNPGQDKESNWLPAPDGRFVLMLRMYWPKEAFLNGSWEPPEVMREPTITGTPVGPTAKPD
ncbi:MAG TPA: DUF1254 domain-containing protein [Phycisphaerae bacterium]|jgi:hypothetical protein|nr:DUF1254 domain-containing protein [Phycisphaerae bacterium]HOB74812.1 DUF1254 domain-containing protein [Phycisphaerae bacterium]HOJ54353.1 DUF1254 domain-containing protein [Phycisphaerae bacterium]HOL26824.1 DUF1254 domain-containing protein [Phycisphaerae bacterium]HPP19985.1 DUF1254 domain-containing protein [Phycisphaerae bacterium]